LANDGKENYEEGCFLQGYFIEGGIKQHKMLTNKFKLQETIQTMKTIIRPRTESTDLILKIYNNLARIADPDPDRIRIQEGKNGPQK
jgi:hypothetical protein